MKNTRFFPSFFPRNFLFFWIIDFLWQITMCKTYLLTMIIKDLQGTFTAALKGQFYTSFCHIRIPFYKFPYNSITFQDIYDKECTGLVTRIYCRDSGKRGLRGKYSCAYIYMYLYKDTLSYVPLAFPLVFDNSVCCSA